MRQIACVLSFVFAQQLAAQSAGPYSVTHSYPLGWNRKLGLRRSRSAASPAVHRPAESRHGRRRGQREAARRGDGHPRRARHGDRRSERPRLRDVRATTARS